jgi:nucleotide-binding universal stress UspA family protein
LRILVALDFTTRSHRGLRRAGLLAGPVRGNVMLMHVVDGHGDGPGAQDRREAQRMILEQIAVVPELFRTTCEPIVIGGQAPEAILNLANVWDVDLVVVGSRPVLQGRTSGRTVRSLIRESPCPVLVVRRAVEGPYARILAPVDLTRTCTQALRPAQSLGLVGEAEVTVVHAFEALAKTKLSAIGVADRYIDGYVENWRAWCARELDDVLDANSLTGRNWARLVEEGNPREVIHRTAILTSSDLLLIGTHECRGIGRILRGSVTEDLLFAPGPDLLVVPTSGPRSTRRAWLSTQAAQKPGGRPIPWLAPT